jgi:predicted PurR-regulated permease PerM
MASSKKSWPSGLLVAVVAIAALYLARVVFIPLALALLFSLLLTPVVSFLEKIMIPRLLAIFFVVLVLLSLIGFVGWKNFSTIHRLNSTAADVPEDSGR